MGLVYGRTPDAPPWMSGTVETQRDPRVVSLIPAGETSGLSSSTRSRQNGPKATSRGLFVEPFSLTPQTFQLQN
jgi:hypothetical protein